MRRSRRDLLYNIIGCEVIPPCKAKEELPMSTRPSLPAEVHTQAGLSVRLTPPGRRSSPSAEPGKTAPPARPPAVRAGRLLLRCFILLLALSAVLGPVLGAVSGMMGGRLTGEGLLRGVGWSLLRGGLPPVKPEAGADGTGTHPPEPPVPEEPTDPPEAVTGEPPSDTQPPDGSADPDAREETAPPEEADSGDGSRPDSRPSAEPPGSEAQPPEDTAPEPPAQSPDTAPAAPNLPAEPATQPDTPPDPPAEPIPEGCFPVHSLDMSRTDRGAGYIIHEGGTLPQTLPSAPLWTGTETPAVLLVNTHPYEGYGDGSAYYDPASGGLAQTDSPNASDGTVALASALARYLRDTGVTVIHLRVAVSAGESSAAIYDRTEDMIRYYCRLYPDIGLVLDLRRSAELTSEQGILRTRGQYRGEPCAQLRITVSGGRAPEAVGCDLAAALALRRELWGAEPTLSRPVRVRSGGGPLSELSRVRVLTLELGSAGNTWSEAARLVAPLGSAVAGILRKKG